MHAVAIEGTFDDCQALVKAMFNDLAFRDRLQLAGVNSINWARIVAQIDLLFRRRRRARRPAPAHARSRCRPATSATSSPATCAKAHGPADRAAGDRHQRERHPPRARGAPASTSCAASSPPRRPSMDIQVSSNFERFLFEASGRDAAFVRGKMGGLRQSRSVRPRRGDGAYREAFTAERVERGRGGRLHPAASRPRAATCSTRTRACAVVAARQDAAAQTRHIPHIVLATAHPGQVPRRHAGHHRRAAGAAAAACAR